MQTAGLRCAANFYATFKFVSLFTNLLIYKKSVSLFTKSVSLFTTPLISNYYTMQLVSRDYCLFLFLEFSSIRHIKNHVGKLLVVPNVTRWNSVYDGVTCLLLICDRNKAGRLNACRKLETRFFTASSSFALQ